MFDIEFSKRATKFLVSCSSSDFNSIDHKIKLLRENPYRRDLDIVILIGRNETYRLRVGKIRLLFTIIKDKVLIYVFDAGYRGDIY